MSNRIYLVQADDSLKLMDERPYGSEELLQALLERYPELLAGDSMAAAGPRRWLLVSREFGVPDEPGGADRWSLDHLFLDQEGIPTLVEVKRSTDTRIRREVVGQMLDYAANAVVHWPAETLRARFESRCEREGRDPMAAIAALLGMEPGNTDALEAFWRDVKTNLQAGRVRLVFVADTIPPELRRIVEFLNAQMDPAEVVAIEVRQFVGDGVKALIPQVVGQTAASEARRHGGTPTRPVSIWNEERFLTALGDDPKGGAERLAVARRILQWSQTRGRVDWGRGEHAGSMQPFFDVRGGRSQGGHALLVFIVWTYGVVEVTFQYLKVKPGFASDEAREALRLRLIAIPGVTIAPEAISKRPTFDLLLLRERASLEKFFEAVAWTLSASSDGELA